MMRKLLILLQIFVISGCSNNAFEAYQTSTQAIRNGEVASDAVYGSVVAIAVQHEDASYVYCSGVLIAENVVLTAAHCLSDDPVFPFTQFFKEGKIAVIAAENAAQPPAERIFVPERYALHDEYRAELSAHDIGLIWLTEPVPGTIAKPTPLLTEKDAIWLIYQHQNPVTFVGYGLTEEDRDSMRLKTEGFVKKYCAVESKEACAESDSYGQHIIFSTGSLMHNIEKGGPCSGDSGGPVLAMHNDVAHVLAIVSAGDADCADYAISTTVPDHYGWIYDTMYPSTESDDCSALPMQNKTTKLPWMLVILTFVCFILRQGIRRRKSQNALGLAKPRT